MSEKYYCPVRLIDEDVTNYGIKSYEVIPCKQNITVKELVEILQQCDPDSIVKIYDVSDASYLDLIIRELDLIDFEIEATPYNKKAIKYNRINKVCVFTSFPEIFDEDDVAESPDCFQIL